MTRSAEIRREIASVELRLNRLHTAHIWRMMAGAMTRATTTTYNARCADLCVRRDSLRRELREGM
jgi:hypothetical protein